MIARIVVLQSQFQSTRPCGARQKSLSSSPRLSKFQSTRPCGARLERPSLRRIIPCISIHAPVWGATAKGTTMSRGAPFHSTRPGGARRQQEPLFRAPQHFNPRARVGRDSNKRPTFRAYRNFNPRARVGRDRCHTVLTFTMCHFNPRARVGRDGSILIPCCFASYFNPRARVGRDEAQRRKLFNWFIFQSTRPCGARLSPWSSIRLIM